jgi:hypothetical protein
MPTAKTECTELSVAFGLLDLTPGAPDQIIREAFGASLPQPKITQFRSEFRSNQQLYQRLLGVGKRLRNSHPSLGNQTNLAWTGPEKQASTASASKDLLVGSIPISVKTDSDVVANLSPYNLFENLPRGAAQAANEGNWFLHANPQGFQEVYGFVREQITSPRNLPESIAEFEATATKSDRKNLAQAISRLSDRKKERFQELYVSWCRSVAQFSAETFNRNFAKSLASTSKNTVLEHIAKWFFRLNSVEYLLCGIDKREEFAVIIPDITSWKRKWRITNAQASPDLDREQSVVRFTITCHEVATQSNYTYEYHDEIRWSHGKFCGNPEAKLYKNFAWKNMTFFKTLF